MTKTASPRLRDSAQDSDCREVNKPKKRLRIALSPTNSPQSGSLALVHVRDSRVNGKHALAEVRPSPVKRIQISGLTVGSTKCTRQGQRTLNQGGTTLRNYYSYHHFNCQRKAL